jgi:rRNA maturation RNase YbeY
VGEAISGEIYISVDRVRENAANEGCTIKNELHRVLFHGVLHLCGYKDKTKKDKITMTAKENFYLASI